MKASKMNPGGGALPTIPRRFLDVLHRIVPKLTKVPHPWVLTGSLALRLRGVPLEVDDIELQTTRAGAYAIEKVFAPRIVRPVCFSSTEQIRSHFGEISIGRVRVEIMGGIQKKLPDGSWSRAVDWRDHTTMCRWNELTIPMLDLHYEYEAYRILGREQTAADIARTLHQGWEMLS